MKQEPAGANAAPLPNAPLQNRLARAVADVHFDSESWLKPFAARDPAMTKVVLATEPAATTVSSAQGVERLRELVLDPAYQLK
jgi:hypothetical protein